MRRGPRIGRAVEVGFAWYTPESWRRLCELADDRQALDDSFEDWEREALAAICDLECVGRRVRKVPIDVEELATWCRERGIPLDGAARAEYVIHMLQKSA